MPWRKGEGRGPLRAESGAQSVGMMPLRVESLGAPLLRLLHLQSGKPRLLKGCREAVFGPHLYPDTNLSEEMEGPWEKTRGCWPPLSSQ